MCLELDGRTTGWLNKPSGLVWQNQIKFSVAKDRANHRWADVNGTFKLHLGFCCSSQGQR